MKKIKYLIKQLFPLTYRSRYMSDGKQLYSVWCQWFGLVWDKQTFEVDKKCDKRKGKYCPYYKDGWCLTERLTKPA